MTTAQRDDTTTDVRYELTLAERQLQIAFDAEPVRVKWLLVNAAYRRRCRAWQALAASTEDAVCKQAMRLAAAHDHGMALLASDRAEQLAVTS